MIYTGVDPETESNAVDFLVGYAHLVGLADDPDPDEVHWTCTCGELGFTAEELTAHATQIFDGRWEL